MLKLYNNIYYVLNYKKNDKIAPNHHPLSNKYINNSSNKDSTFNHFNKMAK
jgi:hypothetical protein